MDLTESDHSTVCRELRRVSPGGGPGPYRGSVAQADADVKARRPEPAKLATDLVLRREVRARLERNHSPEQVARRLREDLPDADLTLSGYGSR